MAINFPDSPSLNDTFTVIDKSWIWDGVAWTILGVDTDHGNLSGLNDDDHTQYHTDARGDARYVQLTDTFGGDVSGTYDAIIVVDDSHNHIISNVDGLQAALDAKQPLSTVLTNTTASFTTADETKLDYITVTQDVNLDTIESRVNALDAAVVLKGAWDASSGAFPGGGVAQAGDSYIVSVAGTVDSVTFNVNDRLLAILDNASTTSYAANWLKLDYTDQVLSVNSQTGVVVLDADDIDDTSTTNKFVTASDLTNLSNLSGTNTGDQTAADIRTLGFFDVTNDGTGSGLDADLLDGQEGTYYQPASSALTTSTTFGGDVSGTYDAIVVADDSHTHDAGNLTGATLASGVTASSLTSVGTLSSLTVSGNLTVDTNTLFVNSTNNRVGVGTTSPATNLEVQGTGNTSITIDAPTGSYGIQYFAENGTNQWHYESAPGGGSWALVESGVAQRLTVLSGGNVGIGTASPTHALHVNDGMIHVRNTGSGFSTHGISNDEGILLSSVGMNTTSKFTPSIFFGSTDPDFTTENPKGLAAITGAATSTYNSNTASGMNIQFHVTGPGEGSSGLLTDSDYTMSSTSFYGFSDNTKSLGASGLRWVDVWAVDSTINTSDERDKTDIVDVSRGLDFVNNLRPVEYRWNDRSGYQGVRTHMGFVAQDVAVALGDPESMAIWINNENSVDLEGNLTPDRQGLRYHEFIAPIVKAVQELSARIVELEAQLVQGSVT